jgi:hypothetical protein
MGLGGRLSTGPGRLCHECATAAISIGLRKSVCVLSWTRTPVPRLSLSDELETSRLRLAADFTAMSVRAWCAQAVGRTRIGVRPADRASFRPMESAGRLGGRVHASAPSVTADRAA